MSARRLRDGTLEVRARRGAERMKLWPNRPSKYLKDLFAEAGVPAFERADLPLVWLDGELVFTGALGMDIRFCDELAHDDTLVRFEFRVCSERPRTGPISPTGPLRSVEAGAENVFSAFAGTSDACGLFFITSVECETCLTSEVWQSG